MEKSDTKSKNASKDKVALLVVGALVGGVISAAACFAYAKSLDTNTARINAPIMQQAPNSTPPDMNNQQGPNMQNRQNRPDNQGGQDSQQGPDGQNDQNETNGQNSQQDKPNNQG